MSSTGPPPLSWSVGLAIALLWTNVAIGVLFFISGRLLQSTLVVDAAWTCAFAALAIGLQRRAPVARTVGLVVAGLSYAVGLLSSGLLLSTTLVIIVALMLPSTNRAVTGWRVERNRPLADSSSPEASGFK